ncbi:MAG TPA: nuclear transport factor 2 family protein [Gaiellaceae bacterium]|jgi:predicted ester cyclase
MSVAATATIAETAQAFVEACERGKGWEACSGYCHPDATFVAQAEPLADVTTLSGYADWMKALIGFVPDGDYEIRSFAVDEQRNNVSMYGVFSGTHTGDGGPLPPTGKSTRSDYVYVMDFEDGRIKHMTKIWNAGWAMKELGWA